jgi:hypothetical protein
VAQSHQRCAFPRRRGGTALLALAAIAAALARPVLHRTTEEVSVVYALDVSRSVSRRFLNEALEWIAQVDAHYRPAQSRVVVFADRAELVASVDAARASPTAGDGASATARSTSATDLEEGLLAALSGFAPGLRQAHRPAERRQSDRRRRPADAATAGEGARLFAFPPQ